MPASLTLSKWLLILAKAPPVWSVALISVLCFFGSSFVLRLASSSLRLNPEISVSTSISCFFGILSKSCLVSLILVLASELSTLILVLCSLPILLSMLSPVDLASRFTLSAFFLKELSISLPAFLPIRSNSSLTACESLFTLLTGISISILIVPSDISYLLSVLNLARNQTIQTNHCY